MSLKKIIMIFTLILIILTGCTPRKTTTITVVDGYIKNAILKDKKGIVATYDGTGGEYVFQVSPKYPLTLSGGVYEDTNAAFDINMTCGSGKVLSPITTFLDGNSTLVEKLANLGLSGNPTAFSDFAVDFIKMNNSDLAKLAQLLYAVETDSNLTSSFKNSVVTNTPTSLSELFTLAEAEANNTLNSFIATKYAAFFDAVQNLTSNPSEYEVDLQELKKDLALKIFQSGESWKGKVYNTVTSPYSGRVWLDRNLGASQVCTKSEDTECFGDYYQWGRGADGHQESNSTTTTILALDIYATDMNGTFILNKAYPYDWTTADENGSERAALWSKTDGSSICPVGFRVPTIDELKAETIDIGAQNSAETFSDFLKLPTAGDRNGGDGSLGGEGRWGSVLSTTIDGIYSKLLIYTSDDVYTDYALRVNAFSVRCVQD